MSVHGANLELKDKTTPTESTLHSATATTKSEAQNLNFNFNRTQDFLAHDHMATKSLKSGKLKTTVTEVEKINSISRHQMWSLYSDYYDGATWESFNQDMDEKTHIIVARDSGDNSIQGFSTIKKFEHIVKGTKTITIYSGDTIIHPKYWGQKSLHLTFFMFLVKTRFANPLTKVFWFLLCNGFRTYLVFARNIPKHWPRYDKPTPLWEKNFILSVSSHRFGNNFDAEKGIVRFTNSLGKLKPNVAPIGEKELQTPEIRFLVEKNPGYINGDELACLGEINFRLILLFPLKLVKKVLKSLLSSKQKRSLTKASEAKLL